MKICHADPPGYDRQGKYHLGGTNYGKPFVPVDGLYDNKPIQTCRFCGQLLCTNQNVKTVETES